MPENERTACGLLARRKARNKKLAFLTHCVITQRMLLFSTILEKGFPGIVAIEDVEKFYKKLKDVPKMIFQLPAKREELGVIELPPAEFPFKEFWLEFTPGVSPQFRLDPTIPPEHHVKLKGFLYSDEILYYVLVENKNGQGVLTSSQGCEEGSFASEILKNLSFKMLSREMLTGEADVNIRGRTFVGREPWKVKKLIVIGEKNTQLSFPVLKPIQWQHTWQVMGHWRKIEGLGKNSKGDYVVMGLTWVKPHEKGEGPLVVKTRLIK